MKTFARLALLVVAVALLVKLGSIDTSTPVPVAKRVSFVSNQQAQVIKQPVRPVPVPPQVPLGLKVTELLQNLPAPNFDLLPLVDTGLTPPECRGRTQINVVAHEDDDILFINPTVANAITRGDCVRTVFVTAGDDGNSLGYISGRERGAQKAYDLMVGHAQSWNYYQPSIGDGKTVTAATPKNNRRITLIYLHLPDGNLNGQGFSNHGYSSLAKLHRGDISQLKTVSGGATYTSDGLTNVLKNLITSFLPSTVNTQSTIAGDGTIDHSDHTTVGQYVTSALTLAHQSSSQVQASLHYYSGYPIRERPANLSPGQTNQKAAAFFAYAAYDNQVCKNLAACQSGGGTYDAYFSRQYELDH